MPIAGPLLRWFARHGRSELPWRQNRDPYRVVVSEFMLQQTQVERVVPIFERFVTKWPSFAALGAATQADVVRAWQGLGYNSRAVRLHRLACAVRDRHGGELPRDEDALRLLPGVGPYTARAIAAFAFERDVAAVDTNVRRIVHRTQFGIEFPPSVASAELDALATALIPRGNGYAFNSALMDLGATLCTARAPKCFLCPLRETCVAAPLDPATLASRAAALQVGRSARPPVPFERSTRYVRGRVVDRLRALPAGRRISFLALYGELATTIPHHDEAAVRAVVSQLSGDGIVDDLEGNIRLA